MHEPLEQVGNGRDVELVGNKAQENTAPAPTAEELLARANALGDQLRALIIDVKRLPREKAIEPHLDPFRSLNIAQQTLQSGFLWLRRAIEAPKVF